MCLQIGVHDQDQPSLQFLWREDPTSDVVVQQYTCLILRTRDSSACANYGSQKTAIDNMYIYPEAASVVAKKFYMGNTWISLENPRMQLKLVGIWSNCLH